MNDVASLRQRREHAARTFDLQRGAVLVPAGAPIPIEGTDQYHDFWSHPEFRYLAGESVSSAVVTFDPGEGWSLFAPVASFEDRVWVGDGTSLESIAAATGIDRIQPLDLLRPWLEARRAEPVALLGNHDIVRRPAAYGLESWAALEIEPDGDLSDRLSTFLSEQRRAKDPDELARMRAAAAASVEGHLLAMRTARPGITERRLQVEFEAEFFRNGGDRTAYTSLVGSGGNSAILHWAPSNREMNAGDLLLIDAAADVRGYAADVTRTMPVGPRFEGIQRDLYQLVLDVQQTAVGEVRPGVEFRDLHLAASRRIAAGLADLDILRGHPDSLVERDAHANFFPHGLGHMLGLSTHDAGGCLAGRSPSDRFGLKWLRADLPLDAGYVVTIEPGIYFIPAILNDPARRDQFRDAVNWEMVDSLMPIGGIRIEDDVHVTAEGAEVLSAGAPKSIAEIEAIRQEAFAS